MLKSFPRLPLKGELDITYRCNNRCRHCWLWMPHNAPEQKDELTFDEIRHIVDDARSMGCREWSVSGGEPMLRPDFQEIFDYITRKAVTYSLNTNGTLITPDIARLLKRKGSKMIALYGATAEVYDVVTRNPGGFDAVMQGIENLREAGVGFIVQLIPMRENFHQWDRMVCLAQSLSDNWRIGASWLHLSCSGNPERNREISEQRLSPIETVELNKPDPSYDEWTSTSDSNGQTEVGEVSKNLCGSAAKGDDRLFTLCISGRRNFHIDPYGMMSWCSYIKDPALRFDLHRGTFRKGWEEFIPSCASSVTGGNEWRENCGFCEKRSDCHWCASYAMLETGRYSAPIPYLCAVADETLKFKEAWRIKHRRYFRIAGISVCVESDFDIDEARFKDEFTPFKAEGPGEDNVTIRHYFELPDIKGKDLGKEFYRRPPWAISLKNGFWIYKGISNIPGDPRLHHIAVFNNTYTRAAVYSPPQEKERTLAEGWDSLSLLMTDQIWLIPLLANRNAVLLHSGAAIINSCGIIFVGHSEAGKSTTMEMLKSASGSCTVYGSRSGESIQCEILCDDRNIIRKWPALPALHKSDANVYGVQRGTDKQFPAGWRVHGTWSHGTTPDVSGSSAPLRAILFPEQAAINEIRPITDRKDAWKRLLATLIRPMVTSAWWKKELDVLEEIVNEVPCFTMHFDKSGEIVHHLAKLTCG